MSLVVTVETERGLRVAQMVDEGDYLRRLALQRESTGVIGTIDPFGQTMFNRLQLPQLIFEIDTLLSEPEPQTGNHSFLRELAAFAKLCVDKGPHHYLWFHGD
jgi:hypothetical protein